MPILRFITAGSVDDGKSTLIGRLLHDTKAILADQLLAIEKQSGLKSTGILDLSLITDGLRAEREQGITIDVAYKYFSTAKRKFISVDAPGHFQYTRNLATGASNCDLAVILVDARKGVVEQTRRHTMIMGLLGIKHVVLAVNKMDLVRYAADTFNNIVIDYNECISKLGFKSVSFIPVSALNGDNIVRPSNEMTWYEGPTLLEFLEDLKLDPAIEMPSRFRVQYVIKANTPDNPEYRGYAGKIISGNYRVGDRVTILPSGVSATIKAIDSGGRSVDEAFSSESVILRFQEKLDVGRGDLVSKPDEAPAGSQEADAMAFWMSDETLIPGKRYLLQSNSFTVKVIVKDVKYRMDVSTLDKDHEMKEIRLNDIALITLRSASPFHLDKYESVPSNGSAILIDETSNATVAALTF